MAEPPGDGGRAAGDVGFGEHAFEVFADGSRADPELAGGLIVGVAGGYQREHLVFAFGQCESAESGDRLGVD